MKNLTWRQWRPVLLGAGGAFAIVLVIAVFILQTPTREWGALINFLLFSSVPSLLVGYILFFFGQRRLTSIRWKIWLAYGLGIVITIANIYVTSRLMFLNTHDFTLLGILLIFSTILSLSFGFTLAAGMTDSLAVLQAGTQQLAEGDLSTRVELSVQDELFEVAKAFNTMAARLEESFTRQRELEQARRDLIAAVSHDLRTPLASARAMVEALADRVVTDEETIKRYHHTIQSQITSLSGLINDLFELSKIDRGQLQLHLERASLSDLISDTLESMRAQAARKNIALNGEVSPDVLEARLDTAQMQRVLFNLVQNAIRHTPPDGTIAINARAVEQGVQVAVIDNGEGIDAADLTRIFEGFYRGEKSRNRNTGGAGLGLAIAKGIIEAHGGHIWVESRPGQGAVFQFTLPNAV